MIRTIIEKLQATGATVAYLCAQQQEGDHIYGQVNGNCDGRDKNPWHSR